MSVGTIPAPAVADWLATRSAEMQSALAVLSLSIGTLEGIQRDQLEADPKARERVIRESIQAQAALYGCRMLLEAIDNKLSTAVSGEAFGVGP